MASLRTWFYRKPAISSLTQTDLAETMQKLARINQIEVCVKESAIKLTPTTKDGIPQEGHWGYFATKGPRRPRYEQTPGTHFLFQMLHSIRQYLPDKIRIADMGAGLGLPLFAFSLVPGFEEGVGFEFDGKLCSEAEKIREKLGIDKIRFENKDFLSCPMPEVDLSRFNVIYIFKPFLDDFEAQILERLKEAKPGTIVIFYEFYPPHIILSGLFKHLNSSYNFYTFERV